MSQPFEISVEHGDILTTAADVVVLKHAQAFYGADRAVAEVLIDGGADSDDLAPGSGDYIYLTTGGRLAAAHALFVGVKDLGYFDYPDIRKFASRSLEALADVAPATRRVAMTVHGPEFGLDEIEALLAQYRGLRDAERLGRVPAALSTIMIVEIHQRRAQRLAQALDEISTELLPPPRRGDVQRGEQEAEQAISTTEAKALAFVAMPFKEEMNDHFYYGIQQPVRSVGFICERIDQAFFTGDILQQIQAKIENAAVVIADITGSSANVFLEIGYAWGRERPTILLAAEGQDLKFDIQGQRCLRYKSIRHLEELLEEELSKLIDQGAISTTAGS